jgi:CheY-like chemotaxis protein
MHVLILEDDFLFAWRLEDILRGLGGTSFAIASTATEALESATEHRPDLITADLRLPDGCGTDAVEAIRSRLGAMVPVVYITADAEELAGVPDAVIVAKPITEAGLRHACRTVLDAPGAG